MKNIFEPIGVKNKEAEIYFELLKIGEKSIQDLSRACSIKRPTMYVHVKSLLEKGLVHEVHRGKKKYIKATPPEKVVSLFDEELLELQKRESSLFDVLPQLQSLHSAAPQKPVIEIFQGEEAIQPLIQNAVTSGHEVLICEEPQEGALSIDDFLQLYEDERLEHGVGIRKIIASKNDATPDAKKLVQVKYVDTKKFPFPETMLITTNRVIFLRIDSNPEALVLQNQLIADSYRELFELAFS